MIITFPKPEAWLSFCVWSCFSVELCCHALLKGIQNVYIARHSQNGNVLYFLKTNFHLLVFLLIFSYFLFFENCFIQIHSHLKQNISFHCISPYFLNSIGVTWNYIPNMLKINWFVCLLFPTGKFSTHSNGLNCCYVTEWYWTSELLI